VSDPLCHAPITVPRSVSGGHAPDACRRRPAEPRSEAAEALRSLVDATVLVPAGDELTIELKGNLAAMFVRGSKCEEVARGRPLAANSVGCGGSQPTVPPALYVVAA
jgi:hypothetical protein